MKSSTPKKFLIAAILFGILLTTIYSLLTGLTFAFNPPTGPGGSGGGAIGVDAGNNLSIGSSTIGLDSKVLIQASSTNTFILKVVSPTSSPILVVRNNGRVGIATSTPTSTLTVQGDLTVTGIIYGIFNGQVNGTISAANVSADVFGRLCCGSTGNYSFPASLGVSTSSQIGLPQQLSVYGNAYVSGSVGIGTTAPNAHLTLNKLGGIESQLADGLKVYRYTYGSQTEDYLVLNKYLGEAEIVFGNPAASAHSPFALRSYNGTTVVNRLNIDTNGNVGIGTSSPAYRLDVGSGDVNVQSGVYRQAGTNVGVSRTCAVGETVASTTVSGGIITRGSCVNLSQSVLTGGIADKVAFWTGPNTLSATSTFHWDNVNGGLGIGTTTPGVARLAVQGRGTGSGSAGFRVTNNAGATSVYVRDDGKVVLGGITPAGSAVVTIDAGSGSQALQLTRAGGSAVSFTLDGPDNFQFESQPSGAGEDRGLTIKRAEGGPKTEGLFLSGLAGYEGFVGIGTLQPRSRLVVDRGSVASSGPFGLHVLASGLNSGDLIRIQNQDASLSASPYWNFVQSDSGNLSITDDNTFVLTIEAGARADSIYVSSNGNVNIKDNLGFGTVSPLSALHVPDGSYAQFEDNNAGPPPPGDCDANNERGRLSIDTTNNRLYICNGGTRGWDYITLTD